MGDGNEAAADVAYRLVENVAIYPITPSSAMAESCDEWAAKARENIWGTIPDVIEMQSEGGAAGAVHGSLQAGAQTTTFTASQGLLLMIPNMYKIAGELTPFCMHVTARTLATHALSIFGDHSDVMACRQTGFAMLVSGSVQEAHDMAAVAHAATLDTHIPFMHFFDGFRTSHEINTYVPIDDDTLRSLVNNDALMDFRQRALSPDAPVLRGTAQNPDVFFQAREAINSIYDSAPVKIQSVMDHFKELTGRAYHLFDYVGAPDAERVIIIMGSGAETASETAKVLTERGEKVGVVVVHLYRPFSIEHFLKALPATTKRIAVLDRTKEPGAPAEPLHLDISMALEEARRLEQVVKDLCPRIIGGRYGLGSKEFTPAMVVSIFDELQKDQPLNHFTVGIEDDVTHRSLTVEDNFDLEGDDVFRSVFYGLGADGTVGANKNSIKIIGGETENHAQAYFVYDSKKSGAMTVSHLRFGLQPIRAPYLIQNAGFVACHQFSFLDKYDVLAQAAPGAVFLLNCAYGPSDVWQKLPGKVQLKVKTLGLKLYVINGTDVARKAGMGARINTIMQTCFFAISGILPRDEAIEKIKGSIEKTYGKKGPSIVEKNFAAVDAALANLHIVTIPEGSETQGGSDAEIDWKLSLPANAPEFVRSVSANILSGLGDTLPVSAFPLDGTWPTATSQWEKRNIAVDIPQWDANVCIQCNKCTTVCPHAAIRSKFYPESELAGAPESFSSTTFKSKEHPGQSFTIQVAPEDCTGCQLCVKVCPAKNKANPKFKALNMVLQAPQLENERENFKFFLGLPEVDTTVLPTNAKFTQFRRPLFEFSGACAGCGETPYIKLVTQLFGDRMVVANATGCSSIYGGNLPTTPYCVDDNGRGPAWSNSLFEDNAEFGLGMRMAVDTRTRMARDLCRKLSPDLGEDLIRDILNSPQEDDAGIKAQRQRVHKLKGLLSPMMDSPDEQKKYSAAWLNQLADNLVQKSVWIFGGDGWAYDIDFGGLDHVLASGRNVNVLVMDTEVYSNTGGQQSKSTPIGAIAKFAAAGKAVGKKDLGLMAMSYGNVYVASIAIGAKDAQTVQAIQEAERHPGPSLILAYSHCIAHGYNLEHGLEQQKMAVKSGYWPLYRFNPRNDDTPKLKLDSPEPSLPLSKYMEGEGRFRMLQLQDADRAKELTALGQKAIHERYTNYHRMATPEPTMDSSSGTDA